MNISKLACAASATAILLAPSLGLTEGKVSVGAAPSAVARINLEVVVPKVVALKVGSNGSTVDTVSFSGITVDIGGSTVTGSGNDWDGTSPTITGGSTGQDVAVAVFSNGGDVTINQTGADLTGATSGGTIPLTDIDVSDGGNIGEPHSTGSSTVTAVLGIVNETDTWTYNFNASSVYAADTYTSEMTYTASVL